MHLALSSPPQSILLLLLVRMTKQLQAYDLTDSFICKRGVPKTQMCSVSVDVFIDSEHPIIFEDYIESVHKVRFSEKAVIPSKAGIQFIQQLMDPPVKLEDDEL